MSQPSLHLETGTSSLGCLKLPCHFVTQSYDRGCTILVHLQHQLLSHMHSVTVDVSSPALSTNNDNFRFS